MKGFQKSTLLPGGLVAVALAVQLGCAASVPSVRELTYKDHGSALFNSVLRSLSAGGYEIRSKDEGAGIIQAFRPLHSSGVLKGDPSYGYRISLLIVDNKVKVTVFPIEGVIGAASPEKIQVELDQVLGGT